MRVFHTDQFKGTKIRWLAPRSSLLSGGHRAEALPTTIEAARSRLADLELDYGVEKSKVDSVRSRLFGALRPYYQERDRLRLLIQYRKGSTRALACGFQRPRWNHASNHEDGLNCHASRPCREGATWNTRGRVCSP